MAISSVPLGFTAPIRSKSNPAPPRPPSALPADLAERLHREFGVPVA
jgi:hypothetical protein